MLAYFTSCRHLFRLNKNAIDDKGAIAIADTIGVYNQTFTHL